MQFLPIKKRDLIYSITIKYDVSFYIKWIEVTEKNKIELHAYLILKGKEGLKMFFLVQPCNQAQYCGCACFVDMIYVCIFIYSLFPSLINVEQRESGAYMRYLYLNFVVSLFLLKSI